jgi:hypothetical protein
VIVPLNLGLGVEEFMLVVRYPDGSDKLTMIFRTWHDAEQAKMALANGRLGGQSPR